ncbi:hypothetical protein E0W68_02040 [Flavobacterium salilacus subsp. salilacus]|uniref:hypothetical protein n=1 Tax=Flavobacterium salilacus TaxID=2898423 RepID=UPI0010751BC3|nr:hypothetical protein [Flavobacterium salilacus]KAF2520030.1 hypothetical protein E0W68_02040 [Flavobacterium salilacus subsp. salilacus]
MKKFILGSLALVLFSSQISCDSDQSNQQLDETTVNFGENHTKSASNTLMDAVLKDQEFKDLIADYYSFFNLEKDVDKLHVILNKFETSDPNSTASLSDRNDFALSLGLSDFNDYVEFNDKQQERINSLDRQYGFNNSFTEGEKIELFIIGFDQLLEPTADNCRRRLRNCRNTAHAGALVAHLGCGTLDLTVIAGLICHGAVAVGHSAALDDCQLDYEECISK